MTKKIRPNLATFAAGEATDTAPPRSPDSPSNAPDEGKPMHKSVYIPPMAIEQLDLLAMQERPAPGRKKKFNTLVLEGLDLLFRDRGLPSIAELTKRQEC